MKTQQKPNKKPPKTPQQKKQKKIKTTQPTQNQQDNTKKNTPHKKINPKNLHTKKNIPIFANPTEKKASEKESGTFFEKMEISKAFSKKTYKHQQAKEVQKE